MTHLLALDLGTTTGWAIGAKGARKWSIVSGAQSFKPSRFEGGGMRYLKFRAWLTQVNSLTPVARVAFEEVRRHRGVAAAHAYGGFLAHLTAWCEEAGVPYEGVPVGTIKAHATGKGNASKEAVIAAVTSKGHAPTDDNEADALAILYWMLEHATTSLDHHRSAPDRQPSRRVPLVAF